MTLDGHDWIEFCTSCGTRRGEWDGEKTCAELAPEDAYVEESDPAARFSEAANDLLFAARNWRFARLLDVLADPHDVKLATAIDAMIEANEAWNLADPEFAEEFDE